MFIKSRILTVLDCMPVAACLLCIRYLEKTFYPGHFSSGKAAAVTLILVFLMAFLYYLAAFTEELGRLLCGLLTGYKFSSFSFGRFTLAKQRGKLRLCRTSSKKLNCIMVPPPMENDFTRSPVARTIHAASVISRQSTSRYGSIRRNVFSTACDTKLQYAQRVGQNGIPI